MEAGRWFLLASADADLLMAQGSEKYEASMVQNHSKVAIFAFDGVSYLLNRFHHRCHIRPNARNLPVLALSQMLHRSHWACISLERPT